MECFKCSISDNRARLFDAISNEGIVKICEKCSKEEDIPIIKRPTSFQLKESERKSTVYERLSGIAGIKKDKKKISEQGKEVLKKQETTLRDIVDKTYKERTEKKAKPRPDLIDNFHWIIMRRRRAKKLTAKQLADKIQESEATIKIAEQGILPEDDNKLINKLESYLGVRLVGKKYEEYEEEPIEIIEEDVEEIKQEKPAELSFDLEKAKTLTIANLQEIKKKKEAKMFESKEEKPEFSENDIEKEENEEDLSNEDMDDLIFGRK